MSDLDGGLAGLFGIPACLLRFLATTSLGIMPSGILLCDCGSRNKDFVVLPKEMKEFEENIGKTYICSAEYLTMVEHENHEELWFPAGSSPPSFLVPAVFPMLPDWSVCASSMHIRSVHQSTLAKLQIKSV